MPGQWVGMGFVAVQQQVVVTTPGGATVYRVKGVCDCGWRAEWILSPDQRGPELARALGRMCEHYQEHMK